MKTIIKWIVKYYQEKREQREIARLLAIKEKLDLYLDLAAISNRNVIHIKSSITTYKSVMNTVKGDTAKDTRRIRGYYRDLVAWYETNLKEEEFMAKHYIELANAITV